MRAVLALWAGTICAGCAAGQVTLTAVERPEIADGKGRAFELVVSGIYPAINFAACEMLGSSDGGAFRNPDAANDFALVFNEVDSWMTSPRFHPTTPGEPVDDLVQDPQNSFDPEKLYWAWADDPNQGVYGLDGVIARLMLAYGGEAVLDVQIAGTTIHGGSWSESFTLVIPEPGTLGMLLLVGAGVRAARRRG